MKTSYIFFLMFTIASFGQNQMKIDSTFNHYFKVLDLELDAISGKENKNFEAERDFYYDEIILDDGEKVYTNKYFGVALTFFEQLTGVSAPKKHRAQGLYPYIDIKTIEIWKVWYKTNAKNVTWCKNKPCIK